MEYKYLSLTYFYHKNNLWTFCLSNQTGFFKKISQNVILENLLNFCKHYFSSEKQLCFALAMRLLKWSVKPAAAPWSVQLCRGVRFFFRWNFTICRIPCVRKMRNFELICFAKTNVRISWNCSKSFFFLQEIQHCFRFLSQHSFSRKFLFVWILDYALLLFDNFHLQMEEL